MTGQSIVGRTFAGMLGLLALAACNQAADVDSTKTSDTEPTPAVLPHQDLIYGRVTATNGDTYQGRIRFGGDEEALWSNYFNGVKAANPWSDDVPSDGLKERVAIKILGVEVGGWKRDVDLGRPFMARFGDIARLEAQGRDLRVTLKSGTEFALDRYSADDYADGVRVWDASHGVVDLNERRIRSIEFLSTPALDDAPDRLHGTVRTTHGDFTGFIQWNRRACLVSDVLEGRSTDGEASLPFETIRSIARSSTEGALATLLDGRTIELSGRRDAGLADGGIYVDDPRYGRALVSWDAFERVDFTTASTGPAYGDYAPGRPLIGRVVTRSGQTLAGRLVYDLDESETTETLDAPSQGVDYTIPFAIISSIALPDAKESDFGHGTVRLESGEELQLERSGDLAVRNGGMLVFMDGRQDPEFVPWAEIARIDLDRSTSP